MSDDIVEQLRTADIYDVLDADKLCCEAADEIEKLRAALKECADDLEAEIMHRYGDTAHKYPGERQKRDQDMAPVIKARDLLLGEKE
jgi:hypothetical protein